MIDPVALQHADAVMPALTQMILIGMIGTLVLFTFIDALRRIFREQDHRLMVMLGCGAAASLFEGFACHLIRCWHSPQGMVVVYERFGIHVPLWLALLYVLFFGAMPYYFLKSFSRKPTMGFFWRTYATIAISESIGEMVTIHLGTHRYWGPQPLPVFGFPLYLGSLNVGCAMATTLIAAQWFDAVRGARRYALIVLTPPVIAGVYSGLTFPTIGFIHAQEPVAMLLGSLGTIVLALLVSGFALRQLPRFAAQYRRMP
jgi:hypothetical protein